MLTNQDKEYISKLLEDSFKKNNDYLVKTMIQMFDTTNERIDKILKKLEEHSDYLNDHERRIEKIEEKVFTTTTGPL